MDQSFLFNVMLENSEEENESVDSLVGLERQQHLRITDYFETIVLNYSLTDFKSHFRFSRPTFEIILEKISQFLIRRAGCPQVQPSKQLAVALWSFGNQEVYRYIADRFGMNSSTLWECVFNVAFVLSNHVKDYIKWPEPQQILHNQNKFLSVANFPGVVGAIDGSHIPISAPIDYSNSYVNRKGFHSIVLQGICDHTMKFIDVYTGFCGSVRDARVWSLSPIKQLISENVDRYFPENTHLIGDSAYPLATYLLTPYKDNGHLTNVQTEYNTKLSKTRIIIERAFGVLKARFRKLHFIYMYNTDMIPLLISSCCILHNICIEVENEPFNI